MSIQSIRMLAEWEPHRATLLAWPHNKHTWPGEQLEKVERTYTDLLKALLPHEDVILLVLNDEMKQRLIAQLRNELGEIADGSSSLASSLNGSLTSSLDGSRSHSITYQVLPTNDCWIRDYGPITVQCSQGFPEANRIKPNSGCWTLWGYNAWGGKYPPWDSDQAVAQTLVNVLNREASIKLETFQYPEILEGGSVECNGAGTLITTESVLLNSNRNPHLNKSEIEDMLRKALGVETIIWLKGGIAGDDTDGHVDDITRFVSRDTIITGICDDPEDPNYEVLNENLQILKAAKDTKGRYFRIETVPVPRIGYEQNTVDGSEFFPASYLNFYIANGVVLLPIFGDSQDDEVIERFGKWFPGRKICPVPCKDLVFGQGGIHCITNTFFYG